MKTIVYCLYSSNYCVYTIICCLYLNYYCVNVILCCANTVIYYIYSNNYCVYTNIVRFFPFVKKFSGECRPQLQKYVFLLISSPDKSSDREARITLRPAVTIVEVKRARFCRSLHSEFILQLFDFTSRVAR